MASRQIVLNLKMVPRRSDSKGVTKSRAGSFLSCQDPMGAQNAGKRQACRRAQVPARFCLMSGCECCGVALTTDSDGRFIRWTLRQIPKCRRLCCDGRLTTGRVIAMAGAFLSGIGVTAPRMPKRQPGSSFKTLRLCCGAPTSAIYPATIVLYAPIENQSTPQACAVRGNSSNKFYGPRPLRTGINSRAT